MEGQARAENSGADIKTGVLLCNLGSPDSAETAAVRRYLKEFLWDPRVVEFPRPLWWLVLNGIILRFRPRRSAAAYAKVWTEQGSPLIHISRQQEHALAQALNVACGDRVVVELAMRYGQPSIRHGMEKLRQAGVGRIVVLPLYPQYSATTTATVYDAVCDVIKTWRHVPELVMLGAYHRRPAYIEALAASVREHWQQHGREGRLLLSFHGIPKRYTEAGDPYREQCEETAQLLAAALQLKDGEWGLSFQSRLGREEWLRPYTDETLEHWGREGVARVDVICPGFSADCLETLEEIDEENRERFLEAGGQAFHYIPALNGRDDHIAMMLELVKESLP